jgi:hypothetical protein
VNQSVETILTASARAIPEPSLAATDRARSAILNSASPTAPSWRRRPSTNLRISVALAGAIAVAVASAVLIGLSHDSQGANVGSARGLAVARDLGPAFSVAHPLPHGQLVSLTSAQTDVGQSIPLPSAKAASASSTGPVFEAQTVSDSGATDTVAAVTYPQSSFVIEYETPVPYADPATAYQTYVNQTPSNLVGFASVGQVAGHPALILQQGKDSTGSNPGAVEFVLGNLKIAVIGYRPSADLLAIAQSVASNTTG